MEESIGLRRKLLRTRILAGALFVICLIFLAFGQIKSIEADAQTELIIKQQMIAEEARAEAEKTWALAEQNETLAQKHTLLASQALEECQKKKAKK